MCVQTHIHLRDWVEAPWNAAVAERLVAGGASRDTAKGSVYYDADKLYPGAREALG